MLYRSLPGWDTVADAAELLTPLLVRPAELFNILLLQSRQDPRYFGIAVARMNEQPRLVATSRQFEFANGAYTMAERCASRSPTHAALVIYALSGHTDRLGDAWLAKLADLLERAELHREMNVVDLKKAEELHRRSGCKLEALACLMPVAA